MGSSEGRSTGVNRTRRAEREKGKGTGGMGEHDSKGRLGNKGARWDTMSTGEQGEGTGAERRMKGDDEGEERVQVYPEEEETKGTRRLRWAGCRGQRRRKKRDRKQKKNVKRKRCEKKRGAEKRKRGERRSRRVWRTWSSAQEST